MRALLLLLVMLFSPLVAAQGDPGAREPIEMDDTVRAVALAKDNGLIAIGTEDPGGIATPVPPNPDADVWFIYSKNGRSLLQEGKSDPRSCDDGLNTDDCQTHVTDIAFDQGGQRLVVVSAVSDASSIVLFVDRLQGPVSDFPLTNLGAVTGVAMNDAGTAVAVTTTRPQTATGDKGRVVYYSWSGSTPTQVWTASTVEGATDVAISSDGLKVAVAAGGDHYRFSSSAATTAVRDTSFPGTALDVAIATSTRHLSVAGSSDGWFQLYEDTTPAGQRELRVRDEESPLQAVAIRMDGTAIAVGNANGKVWVYAIDPTLPALGGLLGMIDLDGAVTDIEFSGDGKSFAVAEGTRVHQFGVNGTAVAHLWEEDLGTGALGKVAIDEKGSMVASAVGADVVVFDALRDIDVATPSQTELKPAETEEFEVAYTNSGNRMENLEFEVDGPAGWDVTIDRGEAGIPPGETVAVTVTVTVPAYAPPGTSAITLEHDLDSDSAGPIASTFEVKIPTIASWSIGAVGPASKDIESGGSTDFVVKVTNLGNVAGVPAIELDIDDGAWDVNAALPGSLQPGQDSDFAVTITSPATAASEDAATATVRFTGAVGSPVRLTATVDASFAVEVTVTPASVKLPPGNETTLNVIVRNVGNAPDSYRLELEVPDDWYAAFPDGSDSHTARDVPAQGTATVQVTLRAPDDADADPGVVRLTAASLADATQSSSDTVDISIEEPEEEEEEGGGGGKGSPFPTPILLLGALLVAVFIKRRT